MKRIVLFTPLFFLVIESIAQVYLNKRLDVSGFPNTSLNVIMYMDTLYLCTQVEETPVPNLSFSASLLQVDLNGNIVNQKRYKNVNQHYSAPLNIVKYQNAFYQTLNTGDESQVLGGIIKYNSNCDTLFTNKFGDTSYYASLQRIIPYYKSNDKLLLIGGTDSTCGPGHQGLYKPIIRVVDTNGVLHQTRLYLNDCKYRNITTVDTTENKGFLIGYIGMFNTWDGDSRVMKLDSNLNVLWNKQINVTSEGKPSVVNHKNQYYMVLSTKVDSVWNFTYKWERVSLTKLDLNGDIIWQKYYGVKERPMVTSGLKECSNGDYIMCGTRRTAYNELQGWIMRTDSAGNLKWWRNYRPQTNPVLDTMADNYLHDVMELPNKDIAAVGWSSSSQISPLQQTWLLKVDSNGCLGINDCPPDVITNVSENIKDNTSIVNVYPNPFSNSINVSYNINEPNTGLIEIRLIEMATGKVISYKTSMNINDNIQFNTEYVAAGVYVINITRNNSNIRNIRVVNIK